MLNFQIFKKLRISYILFLLIALVITISFYSCSKTNEPTPEKKSQMEKVLKSFAEELSSSTIDSSTSYEIIKEFLKKNDFIYGSAWAVSTKCDSLMEMNFCTYVYSHNGKLITKVLPSFKNEDWYTGCVNAKEGYWSKPYFDAEGGEINMITFSLPVYSKDSTKKLLGVITGDLPLK